VLASRWLKVMLTAEIWRSRALSGSVVVHAGALQPLNLASATPRKRKTDRGLNEPAHRVSQAATNPKPDRD